MVEEVIGDLMETLSRGTDDEIHAATTKLEQLRLRTAGTDRETVCMALCQCRELLKPAGRLRRAFALAIQQQHQADTLVE